MPAYASAQRDREAKLQGARKKKKKQAQNGPTLSESWFAMVDGKV
jgi:hypothetical protein